MSQASLNAFVRELETRINTGAPATRARQNRRDNIWIFSRKYIFKSLKKTYSFQSPGENDVSAANLFTTWGVPESDINALSIYAEGLIADLVVARIPQQAKWVMGEERKYSNNPRRNAELQAKFGVKPRTAIYSSNNTELKKAIGYALGQINKRGLIAFKAWTNNKEVDMRDAVLAYALGGINAEGILVPTSKFRVSGFTKLTQTDRTLRNKLNTDLEALTPEDLKTIKKKVLPSATSRLAGTHGGHIYGPGVLNVHSVNHLVQGSSVVNQVGKNTLAAILKSVEKTDALAYIDRGFFKVASGWVPNTEFTIQILENSGGNTSTGGQIGNVQKAQLVNFLNDFRSRYAALGASPSFLDDVKMLLEAQWTGKKPKIRGNKRTKAPFYINYKTEAEVYTFQHNPGKLNFSIAEEQSDQAGVGVDLESIRKRINAMLEKRVEANMGKGNAPKSLNYRTGTFAKSAELKSIKSSATGKSIVAAVTYQRDPYDVFSPGRHLYNELRHPEKLIGRSIRQLMKDTYLAGLPMRTELV